MYLSGLREEKKKKKKKKKEEEEEEEEEVEEEGKKKKNLTIRIDCSAIQINHSINITVLRDVKACSLENKYLCVRKTCCLHLQHDKNSIKVRHAVLRSNIMSRVQLKCDGTW